jgi:dihydroorotate dehydrogenase electron transfer subunit
MVNCGESTTVPRPLSVHQVSTEGTVALFFAVREGGKGTKWLCQRRIGDTLELTGPLGNGYLLPSSQRLLLLGGGIGIAPLYFLAQEALKKRCEVRLLHGASTKDHLYPNELPEGVETIILTEDGSSGKSGMITDYLPKFINWADQVYACGPIGMYQVMNQQKERLLEDKPVQISLEVRMGCGFGVCYSCTIKTKTGLKQVCKDGPVFHLDEVIWEKSSFL